MVSRREALTQGRLDKLRRIRDRNIDPYPRSYRRTQNATEAVALFEEQEAIGSEGMEVSVAGRIVAQRAMGKATFLDVRDGSGKVQAYFRRDRLGEERYAQLDDFDIGDFIGVSGRLFRTRTGEVTVDVADFTILSKSLRPLPEKWHGLTDVDKRYRYRYLDLIASDETRHIFDTRSRVISAVRRFLDSRGFVEVETPVLLPIAAGALARPFATYHNTLDEHLYLRIALELYLKRLVVGGYDKVYEIGRIFRNEGISIKHNPEFTMLESYEAYTDYRGVMEMLEQMVCEVASEILGGLELEYAGNTISLSPPWRRVYLREELINKCGVDFLDDRFRDLAQLRSQAIRLGVEIEENMSWGRLVDRLFSSFVEPGLVQPTFVMDYPIEMSPLAKARPDDPRLVERFECFIGGMEIANAFSELNDPQEQRARFEEQERLRSQIGDEEVERLDEDFLLALEHGMPPTGGLGVGIDRLVMVLTGQQSIREVVLFPLLRKRVSGLPSGEYSGQQPVSGDERENA